MGNSEFVSVVGMGAALLVLPLRLIAKLTSDQLAVKRLCARSSNCMQRANTEEIAHTILVCGKYIILCEKFYFSEVGPSGDIRTKSMGVHKVGPHNFLVGTISNDC